MMNNKFIARLKKIIPRQVRLFLVRYSRWPRIGNVKTVDLLSIEPISRSWGADRGLPIDRYYIEEFLKNNSDSVKGKVLEIGDNFYTIKYGSNKVIKSEILNINEDSLATYIGDLTDIPQIESDRFDCIICTQTLQFIPELEKAINTLYRILKKGGVLLATIPGISRKDNKWDDYWRFTKNSARYLFSKNFSEVRTKITHYGNVFTSSAFLYGLSVDDIDKSLLDKIDEEYQMLICIKVIK